MNKSCYVLFLLHLCLFASQSYSSCVEDHQEKSQENFRYTKFMPIKASYLSDDIVLAKFDYKKRGHLFYNSDSPLKIFVDEIQTYCKNTNPNYIGIDISKRFLTTTRVKMLVNDLKNLEEKIVFINLSETEVDWKITDVLKNLLERNSFNYLNIVDTNASKNQKTIGSLSNEVQKKVISIPEKTLDFVKEGQFSHERIESHKNYYSEFSKH